jgi:hypothetical protein
LDARTRKLAGLAIIAAGIVIAIVGGLADQVGIGANDDSEIGGKQIAALVVGLLLIVGGAVLATVLAKDTGEAEAPAGSGEAAEAAEAADVTTTPAAGTPVTEAVESSAEAEPVEVSESSD